MKPVPTHPRPACPTSTVVNRAIIVLLSLGVLSAALVLTVLINGAKATVDPEGAKAFWTLQQGLKQDHVEMKAALNRIEEVLGSR